MNLPLLDNPPRKANGSIDHTGCPHDATPAGRKLCRDHVAQMAAPETPAGTLARSRARNAGIRAAQRPVAGSGTSGGTTDTGGRRSSRLRRSEPVGTWSPVAMDDVVSGDWVRVTADPSTGRKLWVGELVGWNDRYLSILNPPPHQAFTRHLRVDLGEVINVERFSSDAPEWAAMCAKRAQLRNGKP